MYDLAVGSLVVFEIHGRESMYIGEVIRTDRNGDFFIKLEDRGYHADLEPEKCFVHHGKSKRLHEEGVSTFIENEKLKGVLYFSGLRRVGAPGTGLFVVDS